LVIGITGGIGSGKSVVTSLLRDKFDAAVIDTDTIGHEIMEIGKSAYKKVVEIFANDGEKTFSYLVYPDNYSYKFSGDVKGSIYEIR